MKIKNWEKEEIWCQRWWWLRYDVDGQIGRRNLFAWTSNRHGSCREGSIVDYKMGDIGESKNWMEYGVTKISTKMMTHWNDER